MKSILKVIICFSIFVAFSCSFDNQSEAPEDTLNAVSLQGPTINQCTGYGLFENAQFDCGWKRGYGDWVYHYNRTVDDYDYDPCDKVYIRELNGNYWLYAGQTDATWDIIQITQNNNQSYYNDLFNDLSTDFLRGKADGYQWGRGQEPLAAADPDCYFPADF